MPRKTQITEVSWRGNRKSEQTYNQKRLIQSFHTLHTEKPRPTWWIVPNMQRRINASSSQTLPMRPTLPQSQNQRPHKKIRDQYPSWLWYKKPPWNTSTLDSTTYKKDYVIKWDLSQKWEDGSPLPNQCNVPYWWDKGQKPNDHLIRCRKSTGQNPTLVH